MKTKTSYSPAGTDWTGKLTGGEMIAASGLFSRIRRWALSATGMRTTATHGKESPPAQPNPVAGLQVFALLRREDGQMKPLEIRIPEDTPAPYLLRAAYWEIWSHPEVKDFTQHSQSITVEQISLRPDSKCHLHTAADALVYHNNKRIQLEQNKRAEFDLRWCQ